METVSPECEENSAPAGGNVTVRLTIELPADLHEHIARCCAKRGDEIIHVIRQAIEERFPLR